MILFRYLNKEIFSTLCAVTLVLLFIFISNQFVRYLGYAADGRMAAMTVLHLMMLEVPHMLGLLLPLGLFLSILLAYGRLYVDNEMTVLAACGIGRWQLLKITLPIILAITVFVAIFTLWLCPTVSGYRDQLLAEMRTGATTLQTLLPGRFQETMNGQLIIYAEKISPNHQRMSNIFVAEQSDTSQKDGKKNWDVLAADSGYQEVDKATGQRFIVTRDGNRYVGVPGDNQYQISHYTKYGVRVQSRIPEASSDEDSLSTEVLWLAAGTNPRQAAELQWRFAAPLQVLLLGFLAVPLSRVKPRQGKYAQFLPGILIYMVYVHFLFVAKAWIISGKLISADLGLWWVHALLLLLVGFYFYGERLTYFVTRKFRSLGFR